jgi:hypothetical protein
MNESLIKVESHNNSLQEEIELLVSNLYYPSESDEKIEYFELEVIENQEVNFDFLKMALGLTPAKTICEWSVDEFFRPLLKIEDWYEDEEKKWVADSENLKKLLSEKTTNLKVWKIGEIEIPTYLLGVYEKKLIGVKTKLIET